MFSTMSQEQHTRGFLWALLFTYSPGSSGLLQNLSFAFSACHRKETRARCVWILCSSITFRSVTITACWGFFSPFLNFSNFQSKKKIILQHLNQKWYFPSPQCFHDRSNSRTFLPLKTATANQRVMVLPVFS